MKKSHKMNREFKFPIKFMIKILTWLNTLTKVSDTKLKSSLKVLAKIAKVYDTRGKAECIKYSKHLRQHILKLLGSVGGVQPNVPKSLLLLKQSLFGQDLDYPFIRLMLSTSYSTRFIRLKEDVNLLPITAGPGFTGSPQKYRKQIKRFLKKILGINLKHIGKIPQKITFKEFHMTSKSGPTGHHALWSSYLDVINIDIQLLESIKTVAGERLYLLMFKFHGLCQRIPKFFEAKVPQGSKVIRKITAIRDKEGKTREVAILDYWSQCALRPLHQYLFQALSRIDQDCTHDQSKHIGKLTPTKGSSFHSIDLSRATDRFPLVIEKEILCVWFGEEFANAWEHIMVGYPFKFRDQEITYGTGNPMGAYSSWATFAIAHHFFVYLACCNASKSAKTCPYMLLGDDIVIADDKVAEEYIKLLHEWDIEYSVEKTHSSPVFYEFAKMYVLQNVNVSPFPLAALYERRGSVLESLAIIVRELLYKDWTTNVWDPAKTYLVIVQGFTYPKLRRYFPKLKLSMALMLYLQGKEELGTAIKEYVASTAKKKVKWTSFSTKAYSQYVAGNTVTDLFLEVRDRVTGNNPEPLGELATQMVMAITSLRDGGADCFDLIEAVPFLQIYGRAEERFIQLSKPTLGARMIPDGPSMKAHIEVVDIPISDRDFYVRQRDVIVIKALKASKYIRRIISKHMRVNKNFHRKPILGMP